MTDFMGWVVLFVISPEPFSVSPIRCAVFDEGIPAARICKYFQVVNVTNLLVRIDVNPGRFHFAAISGKYHMRRGRVPGIN
jgi:hypothetical protein